MIQGSFIGAIFFGFFNSHMGISIGHDAAHGSFSKNLVINSLASFCIDIMGGSWLIWTMQHNVGHHPHANRQGDYEDEDFDPDSRSGFPLITLSPHFKPKEFHKYQHLYIWLLFPFVGIKWMYGDLKYFFKGKYQSMEFWEFPNSTVILQIITKSIFLLHSFFLPIYFHGFLHGLILCCILFAVNSYVFSLAFAVNHLTDVTLFPNEDDVEKDWAKLQVMTSSNFSVGSPLASLFVGGLNLQIEHHLFPYISHINVPLISPIVQQTCKEFNVPYFAFPSYWEAIKSYYYHLKKMGNPSRPIRKNKFK